MTPFNRSLPTIFTPEFIAPAGKRLHEFQPYEIGLVDTDTNLTVDSATYAPDKSYKIVFKTPSKGIDNAMFPDQFGAQLPIESLPITRIKRVHLFDKATTVPTPFVAYLGHDGISDCKSINLKCGEDYSLLIQVKGESVRNTFNRNLSQSIPFTMPCCDDCTTDTASERAADIMLDAIKNSPYYITNYMDVEKVLSCCEGIAPFAKRYCNVFGLDVCDSGTSRDLAKVQAQYSGTSVERVSRVDSTSTYEILLDIDLGTDQATVDAALDAVLAETPGTQAYTDALTAYELAEATAVDAATTAAIPADFVMTNVKPLVCDECPDCPGGFTKVNAGDKLIACFDSATAAGVSTLEEFTLEYYADQTTAQDTIDALLEAAGATLPGYVADSVKVIEANCDKLTLQVCVVADTVITEHAVADVTLTMIGECTGSCKGEATVAWCQKENKYKIARTMCLTMKDGECGNDYLTDIKSSLKDWADVNQDSIAITKTNGCITEYTLTQYSNCLVDGCDTFGKDGAKFRNLPAFKFGTWGMCKCEGWTVDTTGCPVSPNSVDSTCRAGLKFTGLFVTEDFVPCTRSIADNIEREPVAIEVSLIAGDSEDDRCDPLEMDWTVVQRGVAIQGSGAFLARDEVTSRQYDNYMYFSPKEALGTLMASKSGYEYLVDPSKSYNAIYLYHDYNRTRTHQGTHSTREQIMVAVESGNVTLLEELKDFFNATLLKQGHVKLL